MRKNIVVAGFVVGLLLPVGVVTTKAIAATPPQSCSWGAKSDPDTVNVAYPDTSATYWSYRYAAISGDKLVVKGTYPRARYFSFHVYQPSGVPLDSIYDQRIAPDPGSSNPFSGPVAAGEHEQYTVTVQFTAKPSKAAPNTIYAGQSAVDGTPNPGGLLMLRVYVPVQADSPAGGVPLPTVTWETTGGQVITAGAACSNDLPSTNGSVAKGLDQQSPPEGPAVGSTKVLSWGKASGNPYAGAFGNQQNAYLTASTNRSNGDLIVIHAKAPTFPDTSAGVPVYGSYQLRYWSFCENSTDTRVVLCAPDYQSNAKDGYYTYVISDASQRPSNATAANGVAWLPWGTTDATAVIIFRNMIPSASFNNAVQDVPSSGGNPAAVMGAYFPTAVYCTQATFEKGGWQACFAAAGVPAVSR